MNGLPLRWSRFVRRWYWRNDSWLVPLAWAVDVALAFVLGAMAGALCALR